VSASSDATSLGVSFAGEVGEVVEEDEMRGVREV
jgi:hypothetical protein